MYTSVTQTVNKRLRDGQLVLYAAQISSRLLQISLTAALDPRFYTVHAHNEIIRICEASNRDLLGQVHVLHQANGATTLQIRWHKYPQLHPFPQNVQLQPDDCKLTIQLGVELPKAVTNIENACLYLSQVYNGDNLLDLVCLLVDFVGRSIETIQTRAQNQRTMAAFEAPPVEQE